MPAVLRVGAAAAGTALLAALVLVDVAVVLVAWFVIGAGVATCYPALFVAAGRAPGLPPGVGIGAVSSVARIGFLLGPALIGALADRYSLRVALVSPGDRRTVHHRSRRRGPPAHAHPSRTRGRSDAHGHAARVGRGAGMIDVATR